VEKETKKQKGVSLSEVQKKLMEKFDSDIKPGLERKYKTDVKCQQEGNGYLYWFESQYYKGRPAKIMKIYDSGRVEVYNEIPEIASDKKIEGLIKKYNELMKESIVKYIDKKVSEEVKRNLKEAAGDPVLDELVSILNANKGGLFSLESPLKSAGFTYKWHDMPQGYFLTVSKRGSKEYVIGSKNMFTLSGDDVVVGELAVGVYN
jgi:hypothetical protein